jgi:transcription termination factor NusA
VGDKLASDLYEEGFRSARDIAAAGVSDLLRIEGMEEKKAAELIKDASGSVGGKKRDLVQEPTPVEAVSETDRGEG